MSAHAAQRLAEAKVKRQKQVIAVGSVVLLAILGFELPKMLGGGGGSSSPTLATVTSSVPGAPAPPPVKLPNTDQAVVQRGSNQLLSFGMFTSKDPFVQQLTTPTSAPAGAALPGSAPRVSQPATTAGIGLPGSAAPATPATAPSSPGAPGATTSSTPSATTPGASAAPAKPSGPPTSALISTNGVCQSISVNGTFPNGQNIFRLVSIAKDGKSVEIAVVGGSYDSGQSTTTLKQDSNLTLVNTADGTRYVITLKSRCAVIQPNAPATTAAATTTTAPAAPAPTTPAVAAPPASTTTPTTPIVTDSLDTTTTGTTTTPTTP